MRVHVTDHLCFGNEEECTHASDGLIAVVHACKHPCHRKAVGYTTSSIPKEHPNYLVLQSGHHLYLNLIDPPRPFFMRQSFDAFLGFVDREILERRVLIHCNQGESRAPSLTLLYMAKRLNILPNDSYDVAAEEFRSRYPYRPGEGIVSWLRANWNSITS